MRIVLTIIGVLFLFVGSFWALQGINILPGSFMSGHIQYLFLGLVIDAAGIFLLVLGNRRRKHLPPTQGSGSGH
ncbi:MAG TPA: hypothetical protein VKF38_11625 [Anaerolineaceae bacterium]|nr:hypothetical protein [Anaerolineaceae bacterium]